MERTNSGIMELSLNSTEKRMLENNVFVLKGILKLHEKTVSGVLSPDMDFAPYDPYKNALEKSIELHEKALESINLAEAREKIEKKLNNTQRPNIGTDCLEDKMYTPEDIAQMLGYKKGTVWGWIRRGDLKAHAIGKKYLISRKQLEKFLSKREVDSDE